MVTQEERDAKAARLAAQIDAAIERLAQELGQGHTAAYKRLLRFWARFHRYSPGNAILILSQRPDATRVAGYHTWRKLGRQVAKGAKAIAIWCPIVRSVEDAETGLPVALCVGFTLCGVFAAEDLVDIESNPLPSLWQPLPDDVAALYGGLRTRIEAAGYPVEERPLPPGRQGSSAPDGRIRVAAGLDSRNRVMVVLHELAHQLEHFRPERIAAPRGQKELEAESAAMVACAMLGIDHPSARDYILSYQGDTDGLKQSLGAIHRIVGRMAPLLVSTALPDETAPTAAD